MEKIMLKSILSSVKDKFRAFQKRKNERQYKGDQVWCSICQSSYRIFTPFGINHRVNARCLNCGSLERHRLLWLFMNESTNLFDGRKKNLLHFAPEEMFYHIFSNHPDLVYTACDLFPEMYDYTGPIRISKADITSIPFPSDSFDVIICNHVLEHIPDDRQAMKELRRVLKPDGWCILQVPLDQTRRKTYEDFSITTPRGRKKAFGQSDHVRWYGQDYEDRLVEAGFTVKVDDFVKKYSPQEMHRLGIKPGEMIFFCTR
jgi:SAM-dependent methyltransferase